MKKSLKIAIVLVLVISFTIGGFIISKGLIPNKDNSKRLEEVKERLIDAQVEKDEEFKKNGFSKKFYLLQDEIDDLNEEKFDLESEKNGFNFVEHIIPGIFIIIFGCVVSIMIFASTHISKDFSSIDYSNIDKNISETLELVNENIKQQTKKNKKFVAAKCPNCGSALKDADSQVCEYCDQTIIRQ